MKSATINEIKSMEAKMPIVCFTGRITNIYPRRTGEGQNGAWSVQNLVFEQGGERINVSAWEKEEFPKTMEGKVYTICAFKGQKGWSGVYASDGKTKEGAIRREIRTTKSADYIEGELANQPVNAPQPTEHINAPSGNQNAPTVKPSAAKPDFAHGVFGGTVGMAIKEACNVVNQLGTDPFSADYSKQVWQVASDLIRVSSALEAGKLAPKSGSKPEQKKDEIPMDFLSGDGAGF